MERTRLVLTLHSYDYVECKIDGRSIGAIRLPHNSRFEFARLVFEFGPEVEFVRGSAKRKTPRTQRPERSLKCTESKHF